MAKGNRNAAVLMGEALTPEESGLLDANREAEHAEPEANPDPAPAAAPEPAPAAASPAPEAAAAAPAAAPAVEAHDIDPATGLKRVVDHGAFHAEREKRKAAEAREREAQQKLATLAGRFDVLEALARQAGAKPAQAAAPDALPDVATDPVAHFQARAERAEKGLEDVNKWRQTQEANATAMNNVQQLQRIALNHEAEFAKSTPDYQDAAAYVRNMRDQELQYMGYADPGVRAQIILQDALTIAAQSLNSRMNAAEVVYNIAKARGWSGKAPAAPPAAAAPVPAPVAAAPAAPAAPSPDAKKIATIAKGQEATQSLGQVNGAAPAPNSVEALLKMSDKEFEEATRGDKWRHLFT